MRALRGVIVLVLALAPAAWGSAADADEHSRWQELKNNPGCVVWNPDPQEQETVTWSGACANGKAQGHGTLLWRAVIDGEWTEERYEGGMKDGMPHGRGVVVGAEGIIEGDWKDGMPHGRGVMVWEPSSEWAGGRYEGGFKDGMPHGRGVWVWADGERYEGDFKDGKYNGRGVWVTKAAMRDCDRRARESPGWPTRYG